MVDRIFDIIMAIIAQIPCIAVMYSAYKVYESKLKHTNINYLDKLSIQLDR